MAGNGADGGLAGAGGNGWGGSIYNASSQVVILGTELVSNVVYAGNGGRGGNGGSGGEAQKNTSSSGSFYPGNGGNGGAGQDGGAAGQAAGGALYNAAGLVTLQGDHFEGNTASNLSGQVGSGGDAGRGGNAYNGNGGDAGSRAGNAAAGSQGSGGAIYSGGGSISVNQSTFENNRANGAYGGVGGSGASSGIDLSNSSEEGRSAPKGNGAVGGEAEGGAITVAGGTFTITNSALADNRAVGGPGGANGSSSATPNSGSDGAGGEAQGGAVEVTGGTLAVINSTFSSINGVSGAQGGAGAGYYNSLLGGNGGAGLGGCINVSAGQLFLNSSTLANGQAAGGSGGSGVVSGAAGAGLGGGVQVSSGASAQVLNTIIAQNTASGDPANPAPGSSDVAGAFTSLGHNLIGDGSDSTGFEALGDRVGNTANPLNPLLGILTENGGPTETMALLPGSPAIDAPNLPSSPAIPATDQRGVPRDAQPDIGAYEYAVIQSLPTLTAPAPQSAFAGSQQTFQLGSFLDTGYAGPWKLRIDWGDNQSNTVPLQADGDLGSQNHTYTVPGTYVVTETITNASGGSDSQAFLVLVGSLSVQAASAVETAGVADNLTVSVLDAFNRPITNFTGAFAFSSSDATAAFGDAATATPLSGNSYTFTSADAGSHVFTVTQNTAGMQTIAVVGTGAGAPMGSATIAVTPAPASNVVFTLTPSSATAGTPFSATAAIEDPFGNIETGDNSDRITLSIASGPGSFAPASTVTVTVTDGIATFSNLVLNTAGNYTLQAASGTLTAGDSAAITISGTPLSTVSRSQFNALQGVSTGSVLLATFTQGSATQAASAYTAAVNWGDSQSDSSTENNSPLTIQVSGQTISVYGSHTYATSGTRNLSVTLSAAGSSATAYPTANVIPNVSSQIGWTASGLIYNRSTQLFGGTITLTNSGTTPLTGTLEVEMTGLPAGVTLANANGTAPDGNPYILVNLPNGTLAPGKTVTFAVSFRNPNRLSFSYGLTTYDENA